MKKKNDIEKGLTLEEMKSKYRLFNGKPTFPFHCENCGTYTKHYYPSLKCVCCGNSPLKLVCFNCRLFNKRGSGYYKCNTHSRWCIGLALENVSKEEILYDKDENKKRN